MIACRVHPAGDCPPHSTSCAWYFTNTEPVLVGPGRLTLADGTIIETEAGYATLIPLDEPLPPPRLELDPGTARLLEALRAPLPEPARVKVRPLGPCEWAQGLRHLYLRCEAGWSVTCTEHGELETYGMRYADIAANIAGRHHLKEKHS